MTAKIDPFKISKELIVDKLITVNQLNVPVYASLPMNSTFAGQLAALRTATGADLYYFDGDYWIQVVDSSTSGGLPSVLEINNLSGDKNIVVQSAITSPATEPLSILAGGGDGSTSGSTKLTLEGGTIDIHSEGQTTIRSQGEDLNGEIDVSSDITIYTTGAFNLTSTDINMTVPTVYTDTLVSDRYITININGVSYAVLLYLL